VGDVMHLLQGTSVYMGVQECPGEARGSALCMRASRAAGFGKACRVAIRPGLVVFGGEGMGAGAGAGAGAIAEIGSHSSLSLHACRLPLVRSRHSVRAACTVTGTDKAGRQHAARA